MINSLFSGRDLLIATKHEKEKVIAPILEKELSVNCFVAANFDTDQLGTFPGDIQRKEDAIATAKRKCLLAMELFNCDLAISSEGSFGPHPSVFFVPADEEFLFFIDKKNGLEIFVRELSTETNFMGAEIKSEKELKEFADLAKFPSHALILRSAKEDFREMVKGISELNILLETFSYFMEKHGAAWIETDMRAMFNPSRMKVIEKASIKLAVKINSLCPSCNSPGFGITDVLPGLPCQICSMPTRSTIAYIYSCSKCGYIKEEKYPKGKFTEEPMFCDVCNP